MTPLIANAHVAVDPDVERRLSELSGSALPPIRDLRPAEIRANLATFIARLQPAGAAPEAVGRVVDRSVAGRECSIAIRVYEPGGQPAAATFVYFHGGGFVAGDLDTHDAACRRLTNGATVRVVAVDYRLAPEWTYPAAIFDAVDVTSWAAEQYPGQPLLVAGDSAGGNLAASVVYRCLEAGGPRISGQVLIYPSLDLADQLTVSDGPELVLTLDDIDVFREYYLPDRHEWASPDVSPLRTADVAGTPPTLIATAGHDLLRGQSEAYAERLVGAGVPLIFQPNPSVVHGWLDWGGAVPATARARDELIAGVRLLVATLVARATYEAHDHPPVSQRS